MPNTHRTTASVLRLREGPGTDQEIIARLPIITEPKLLPGSTADWAKAKANLHEGHVIGWVSVAHIEPLQ